MKLLLINSSARTGGNTGRVMNLFEESLLSLAREQGITLTLVRVNLAQKDLLPCLGCRACFDRGEEACPRKDDLISLKNELIEADGYVIASPVYVEDVNGMLKTLIDRLAFFSHRPALFGKAALLYVTSGIGSSSHSLNTMRTAFGTWGVRVVRGLKFRLGALTPEAEIRARYAASISRAAASLLSALRQQPFRPSFYSLLAFSVQQSMWRRNASVKQAFDLQYWRQSGWLDHGRRYYDPALARGPRATVAYLLGKLIALFFG